MMMNTQRHKMLYAVVLLFSMLRCLEMNAAPSPQFHYFKTTKGAAIICSIHDDKAKTVVINSKVTSRYVDWFTFTSQAELKGVVGDVEIPAQVELWYYDQKYNKDERVGYYTVVGVAPEAFMNCKELVSITLPPTIKYVDVKAFKDCEKLRTVNLPATINSVAGNSFENCNQLEAVNVEEAPNTTYFSFDGILCKDDAVVFCPQAYQGRVKIPAKVKIINEKVFQKHDGITELLIEYGLKCINDNAFSECTNLRKVIIQKPVNEIWSDVFNGCTMLGTVHLAEGLTRVGSRTFQDCTSLKEISIPGSLQTIGACCFKNCYSLERVRFSEGNYFISSEAFMFCTSLQEVFLPSSVKTINSKAFMGCQSLKKVILPSGIEEIGRYAFMGCSSLVSINVPKEAKIYEDTFIDCNNLSLP